MAETTDSEAAILRAVQGLDDKLSNALRRQTDTLTRKIDQLVEAHGASQLEQAKLNATFADRARVETIAEHVHTIVNDQMILGRDILSREERADVRWMLKTFTRDSEGNVSLHQKMRENRPMIVLGVCSLLIALASAMVTVGHLLGWF